MEKVVKEIGYEGTFSFTEKRGDKKLTYYRWIGIITTKTGKSRFLRKKDEVEQAMEPVN